jgi:hypothetical protein
MKKKLILFSAIMFHNFMSAADSQLDLNKALFQAVLHNEAPKVKLLLAQGAKADITWSEVQGRLHVSSLLDLQTSPVLAPLDSALQVARRCHYDQVAEILAPAVCQEREQKRQERERLHAECMLTVVSFR